MKNLSRQEIFSILTSKFSLKELKSLCFRLGIDDDILPGQEKDSKSIELIEYLERRDRLNELIKIIEETRPDIKYLYSVNFIKRITRIISLKHALEILILFSIAIILVIKGFPINGFDYRVRVQSHTTGEYIANAKLRIESKGTSLREVTDAEGQAKFFIPHSLIGQEGRIIIDANAYNRYELSIEISDTPNTMPKIIQIMPTHK